MNLKSIRSFIALAFAAVSFIACEEDTTIRYGNVAMGNIKDGAFVTDKGNIFNVVEKTCNDGFESYERAIIICDVLEKTGESEYDIRLHNIENVLSKAPVAASQTTDEMQVDDPVDIYDAWCAGGYINMYIVFHIKKDSQTAHLINLVYDDSAEKAGTYSFTLRHNAYGEVLSSENPEMVLAGAYVSFPISGLIKEDSAQLEFNWKWYPEEGYDGAEFQNHKATLSWKRTGFDHTL